MMHGTPPRLPAFRQPRAPRPTTGPTVGWLQFGVQGGQSMWGAITLTTPALTDTIITLATDDPNTTVPAAVTITAGQNWCRFPITTKPLPLGATVHRFVWVRVTLAGVTTQQRIVIEPTPPLAPVVTGVFAADGKTPLTHAPAGAPVVILGRGFGAGPGRVAFQPRGWAAVTLWTDTRIEAMVPSVGDSVRRQSVVIDLPGAAHFVPALPEFTVDVPAIPRP